MKKLYPFFLFITVGVFAQPGSLCTDPIVIATLPYSTTDNTANYGDNYDPPTATSIACGAGTAGNYYLGGNDVVYSYTASANGTITIQIPSALAWTGLFVFTNCTDIGSPPYACNCSSAAGNRTINDMAVTAGQTYYIVISSWPSPQTIAYTLNVTQTNLQSNQVAQPKSLALYPNPVRTELFLETNTAIKNVSIISVNGQRLSALLQDNNSINVEGLSAGFYILEMTTEEGLTLYKNFIKATN
ncbi:T9SS type A sorting domain-containing protein [Flavobacterium sp. J49]|uniref:T9SS type A sorting domain-containing protein n=1 Tax=Flavobacterium sp. J49 TaxID=2718534 RepID=UPI0015944455|nr:T9SS type A sorting domain-containing protein [Flavobacterium sp. J49]MBF6642350.1 T9SS type A sorting domain-containing protein [Flavobacterium sp. J49]NIC03596.1 T9SS type A sorting domain-containing protein [Flavobacterium sp. J49]